MPLAYSFWRNGMEFDCMQEMPELNKVVLAGRHREGDCYISVFCLDSLRFEAFYKGERDSSRISSVDASD